MRYHIKAVAVIYLSLGFFVAAFLLLGLIVGALTSLGLIKSATNQGGLGSAVAVFLILAYPTLWLIQTGFGLWKYERGARMWALLIAAILLVGLNSALLLTQDRSSATGKGWSIFYVVLILLGGYTLAVLLPKRGRALFQ
jgi:hypothetical protein